jgi:hypothetical protein
MAAGATPFSTPGDGVGRLSHGGIGRLPVSTGRRSLRAFN